MSQITLSVSQWAARVLGRGADASSTAHASAPTNADNSSSAEAPPPLVLNVSPERVAAVLAAAAAEVEELRAENLALGDALRAQTETTMQQTQASVQHLERCGALQECIDEDRRLMRALRAHIDATERALDAASRRDASARLAAAALAIVPGPTAGATAEATASLQRAVLLHIQRATAYAAKAPALPPAPPSTLVIADPAIAPTPVLRTINNPALLAIRRALRVPELLRCGVPAAFGAGSITPLVAEGVARELLTRFPRDVVNDPSLLFAPNFPDAAPLHAGLLGTGDTPFYALCVRLLADLPSGAATAAAFPGFATLPSTTAASMYLQAVLTVLHRDRVVDLSPESWLFANLASGALPMQAVAAIPDAVSTLRARLQQIPGKSAKLKDTITRTAFLATVRQTLPFASEATMAEVTLMTLTQQDKVKEELAYEQFFMPVAAPPPPPSEVAPTPASPNGKAAKAPPPPPPPPVSALTLTGQAQCVGATRVALYRAAAEEHAAVAAALHAEVAARLWAKRAADETKLRAQAADTRSAALRGGARVQALLAADGAVAKRAVPLSDLETEEPSLPAVGPLALLVDALAAVDPQCSESLLRRRLLVATASPPTALTGILHAEAPAVVAFGDVNLSDALARCRGAVFLSVARPPSPAA
jgi:hypothetical protein